MSRPIDPREIPEEVARFAEAQVAAGRFANIGEVLLAGKEALEQREATDAERARLLRRAYEGGMESVRRHGPQLESDEEFEAFLDEAAAEVPHDWTDYLRYRFEEGRKAIERGEYFSGPPAELLARIRERVESKHR